MARGNRKGRARVKLNQATARWRDTGSTPGARIIGNRWH